MTRTPAASVPAPRSSGSAWRRAALAGTTADESLADGGAPASPPATEAEDPPQASDTTPIPSDPAAVARAIEGHSGGAAYAAYDQVVVGYMLQIAEELREAGGQEAVQLRKRMSRLVSTLEPKTLERLLAMGGDGQQRHQFLLNASQGMAVDAVVDLIRAAGETEERPISQSMLRMLNKLALNAGSGGGERRVIAEQSVRDQVGELLRGWSLEDPNPEAYGKALDAISRSDPLPGATEAMYIPEPQRIIEMALEVDVLGDALTRAVDTLVRGGQLRWLVDTLSVSGPSSATAEIWRQIATPQAFATVLGVEPIDAVLLDALLPHVGQQAAAAMLDALSEVSEARARRLLIDRTLQMGAEAGPAAVERLRDARWYVQRNMLRILGDHEFPVSGFRPADFLAHEDARVRREALRIMLRDPGLREHALLHALGDPDDRMVRTALTAALHGYPPTALPMVASRAVAGTSTDQRVMAIRVLGARGDPAALAVLLKLTARRMTLFGMKTPPKTPEYLAALTALRGFGMHPAARAVLDRARRSRDSEIVQAVSAGAPGR